MHKNAKMFTFHFISIRKLWGLRTIPPRVHTSFHASFHTAVFPMEPESQAGGLDSCGVIVVGILTH
jgi:hypothetical protein